MSKKHPEETELKIFFHKFGRTLGEGLFGKVKVCVEKSTNSEVALKIIKKEKMIKQGQVTG